MKSFVTCNLLSLEQNISQLHGGFSLHFYSFPIFGIDINSLSLRSQTQRVDRIPAKQIYIFEQAKKPNNASSLTIKYEISTTDDMLYTIRVQYIFYIVSVQYLAVKPFFPGRALHRPWSACSLTWGGEISGSDISKKGPLDGASVQYCQRLTRKRNADISVRRSTR